MAIFSTMSMPSACILIDRSSSSAVHAPAYYGDEHLTSLSHGVSHRPGHHVDLGSDSEVKAAFVDHSNATIFTLADHDAAFGRSISILGDLTAASPSLP